MTKKEDADPFDDEDDVSGEDLDAEWDDENDALLDDDVDAAWHDGAFGRLPGHESYGAGLEADELPDLDAGLPHEKAASRRAMLGVPEDLDEDDDSPTRALQDAIIDQVNEILEDEWNWDEAAERAYEALVIDPTYGRAANAVLRCYLTKRALRDMQHALRKLFNPFEEAPNQTQRMLAYSYRVLSRADVWLKWTGEIPPELADAAPLVQQGLDALNDAYCVAEAGAYEKARAAFAAALERCPDRPALMWFLAREYADKGYFADSAALLGALIASGSTSKDVQRLYAEILWWRDQGRWLPWIH